MAVTRGPGARRWWLIACIMVVLAGYFLLSWTVDLAAVVEAGRRLGPELWVLLLSLSLVNYLLRFVRWHRYLSNLGHRLAPGRHLAIYIAGFALTTTPGKMGEGIRALYLKPLGVDLGRCLSALYAERLLDVMAISLLAALLFLSPVNEVRGLAMAGGMIVLTLLALQHPRVVRFCRHFADALRNPRLRRAACKVSGFQADVTQLLRPGLLTSGLLLGLLAWGAEGVGTYLVAQALGIDIGLWHAIGIYALAMLAGALSFLPGGLGGAEAAMVMLLSVAGASLPVAVAATLIVRLATLWFAVGLGVVAWFGLEAFGRRPAVVPAGGPGAG